MSDREVGAPARLSRSVERRRWWALTSALRSLQCLICLIFAMAVTSVGCGGDSGSSAGDDTGATGDDSGLETAEVSPDDTLPPDDALPPGFQYGVVVRVEALAQHGLAHVAGAKVHRPVGIGPGLAQYAAAIEQGNQRQKKQEEARHGAR